MQRSREQRRLNTQRSSAAPEELLNRYEKWTDIAMLSSPLIHVPFSSEIWIMNIDAARPLFRRISANTPLRARVDPEVFITAQGPRIYFGRFLLTDDPTPSPCVAIKCSEGVWISDPGLTAAP